MCEPGFPVKISEAHACTNHLCVECWSKTFGAEGRANQRCFQLEQSDGWSVFKQVRDDSQKQAKLEYVAGASVAKVKDVEVGMTEVERKAIRGVACTKEDEGYLKELRAIRNKRIDGQEIHRGYGVLPGIGARHVSLAATAPEVEDAEFMLSKRKHILKGTTGRILLGPCVFWADRRQKVSQLAPISILASMLLGKVFQQKKWHWYDMALSEHGFYAPKRFTISFGLWPEQIGHRLHRQGVRRLRAGDLHNEDGSICVCKPIQG